jgi:hypothetical protein
LAILVVLPVGSSVAAVLRAASCKTLKAQATGTYALGAHKAFGRNKRSPNVAKLGANLLTARSTLTGAFEKAENDGGCTTADDVLSIEGKAKIVRRIEAPNPTQTGRCY